MERKTIINIAQILYPLCSIIYGIEFISEHNYPEVIHIKTNHFNKQEKNNSLIKIIEAIDSVGYNILSISEDEYLRISIIPRYNTPEETS